VVAEARPATPTVPPIPCESINVDDAMLRAANQFSAGFARAALSLVVTALGCKQTDRMDRMAVTCACMAHDVAAAKLYCGRVSPQFQPPLVQRCQQESITIP
jgi:hypothetical protein